MNGASPPTMKTERQPNAGIKAAASSADREARKHGHDHGRTTPLRTELGGHGDRIRHRAAKPKAGEKAQRNQPCRVLRQHREQSSDAEGRRTQHDDPLAADSVGNSAEDQCADHETEQPRAEHRPHRRARQLPLLGRGRRNVADRLGIEAINEQDRCTDQQQVKLKPTDRMTVDVAGGVNDRGRRPFPDANVRSSFPSAAELYEL
jgi:hypothetical protein